ncbi:MAG: hypothetical protein V7605_2826 [Acidimicrobiaceae bacterium]|jgi:hypothetical protein
MSTDGRCLEAADVALDLAGDVGGGSVLEVRGDDLHPHQQPPARAPARFTTIVRLSGAPLGS